MKLSRTIFLGLTSLLIFPFVTKINAQLTVSENGHYLVQSDGSPFYWLGDTGWGLFQIPNREEARFYLETRSRQGFTVIHAAACHKNPFIVPSFQNIYGDKAFINDDPLKPDITSGKNPSDPIEYDYWDHIEYIIDLANENGLYINLLPIFNMKDGEGYNFLTPENAYGYGKFIGNRFKEKINLIWCIGGDVTVDNEAQKLVWDMLAKGVNEGVAGNEDYSKSIMTFHTRGGHSSSDFFTDAPWLDFDMLQTWDSYNKIYEVVTKDYQGEPAKPILHGEGAYEDGPEYPTKPITPLIIRKQVYWALFAGGLHTYGNSNIWSFGSNPKYVTQDWKEAINSEGARHVGMSRTIMEKVGWWKFIPDQSLIIDLQDQEINHPVAMRSENKDEILVYIANKMSVDIDLSKINSNRSIKAYWINPMTGKQKKTERIKNTMHQEFSPPEKWEDAILYIIAEQKN